MTRNAGITVGELREQLAVFDQDAELYIGDLTFYRLKRRGDRIVQLEFNEQVYRDEKGKWHVEPSPLDDLRDPRTGR